ncbi:MAG: NADH-quinone oxidoreductase subunit N [Anaerolineaceae bacterium]
MQGISGISFIQISPILGMVVLVFVLLGFDLISHRKQRKALMWISASGLALISFGTLLFMKQLVSAQPIWGGLLRMDLGGVCMIALICAGAAVTILFASEEPELVEHGEFSILLVAATLGLALMTISYDLVMLYLAMEMAAIPLYVLAGFLIYKKLSTEAGLKYLLYGGMASAVMLYGFSLLYGISGFTGFQEIASSINNPQVPILPLVVFFGLILVGFGYKIAAVPFHFWAPDVYHGAPSQVSGFLATVSKVAGFAVLLRFLPIVFPRLQVPAQILLSGMAVLSMLLGNLLAMQQKNIKRLLAYSAIAHAGYLLLGVAAGSSEGATGVFYYLSGYLFANLAAFTLAAIATRQTGSEEIASFSGLSRRSPGLAFMFLVVFLSLAGIPPFAGFAGKVFVFLAAAKAGLTWLVVVGVLNSVIALFYYLNVIKVIYARPESEGSFVQIFQSSGIVKIILVLCMAAVLYLGVIFLPWFDILSQAGKMLWN